MSDHDRKLSAAFDERAAQFEKAPVQTDPTILAWLMAEAELAADSLLLDAGCGPGIVSEAFLSAGHRVVGVDLSPEMIERARRRCGDFGERARFLAGSLFDPGLKGPFDAAVSRFVLHHAPDGPAFVRRQLELLRAGGALILCDHTTDADTTLASWHQDVELDRDVTHTRNFSPGELVDMLARAGLTNLHLSERPFVLDFDEWFDRGTPRATKEDVRRKILAGPGCRGFQPEPAPGGAIRIHGWLAIARGLFNG